ncbi:DUF2326 domain-containing protein [Bacillus horti]|uniref:Uncharacterized protein YydD (DUF2326 family) n=1 Tax=Caldalkalibacillus horti TaxID=77523 RepID=A0ABT9VU10_9BACI|nr:DUF2326 domain-containing protein [Bacillus horti]MDQ0164471.1 uncharacterized protein YydD (DUF2326 family) [Bacillus horti]
MKISKIYSNDSRFKEIDFSDGLNIVLGKIVNKENLDSNSHNLGKSTLINLLDFMFLKELEKGHFLKDNKEKFKNHIFFLELKRNKDSFITIKRSVKNSTKVSIKLHLIGKQNFTEETVWDYVDMPLTSNDEGKNPKNLLNKLWGFNKVLPYSYRTFLNYFLRTQYDYDQVFKLSKFRGSDSTWKPPLTDLFGFKGSLIKNKYDLETQLNVEKKLLEQMEYELKISYMDLNKIQALIDVNEKKRIEIKTKIDNFDFYAKERKLNKELIEDIEKDIANLNSKEYKLQFELDKINDSLNKQTQFDLSSIRKLFEEIEINFPEKLEKSYEELVQFNYDITSERNKFLKQNLQRNEEELQNVNAELQILNSKRNEILSVLKEKDSFVKFKKYQMELVEVENEISQLLNKIDNIDILKEKGLHISQIESQIQKLVDKINQHLKEVNDFFKLIQSLFSSLVKDILDETAILFHSINSNNNIEFEAKITSIKEDVLTSKSEGYSYRKMLCVCFDLAVIIAYKDVREFFKFAYHDGSLESMSDTKKIKYIETIREKCRVDGIQYIFTTLEDDIPRLTDGKLFELKKDEVVVVLDDRENDEGRLFGFSF